MLLVHARIAAVVQEPLKTKARREVAFASSPSSSSSGQAVDDSESTGSDSDSDCSEPPRPWKCARSQGP